MGNSDVSRCRSSTQDPQHDVNESSLFCRWFIPELVIRGSSSRASLKTSRWRDVRSHDLWVEEESSGIQQAVFKGTGRTCVRILKRFLKYLNWTPWATNERALETRWNDLLGETGRVLQSHQEERWAEGSRVRGPLVILTKCSQNTPWPLTSPSVGLTSSSSKQSLLQFCTQDGQINKNSVCVLVYSGEWLKLENWSVYTFVTIWYPFYHL